MALETGTYISDLVATNPDGASPKSSMDDHLRLVKSTIKTTFPNVTGAMTMTHTELNTVTARGLIAGQTWTGTHTFPATTYGVTAAFGASGTALATLDYVNAVATNAALPGQTGNAAKFLRTDGTTAAWSELGVKGADIASAATINLTTATGDYVHVTGTTPITAITIPVGAERTVIFDDALALTHGAALLLPGAANITTAANDRMTVRGDTAGAIVVSYTKADGTPVKSGMVLLATLTPTAAANVDFLTTFTSGYDNYVIEGTGLNGSSSSDNIVFRFANGGAVDSGSNYYSASGAGSDTTTDTSGLATTSFYNGGKGGSFRMAVMNVNDATNLKTTMTSCAAQSATAPVTLATSTYYAGYIGGAVSGIRFFWSGGATFAAQGAIRIYGISNA